MFTNIVVKFQVSKHEHGSFKQFCHGIPEVQIHWKHLLTTRALVILNNTVVTVLNVDEDLFLFDENIFPHSY